MVEGRSGVWLISAAPGAFQPSTARTQKGRHPLHYSYILHDCLVREEEGDPLKLSLSAGRQCQELTALLGC